MQGFIKVVSTATLLYSLNLIAQKMMNEKESFIRGLVYVGILVTPLDKARLTLQYCVLAEQEPE